MWGVNANDDIYFRHGEKGEWKQVDGKLKHVAVGGEHGGHVWGINAANAIYHRQGFQGKWENVDGQLT